VVMSDRGGYDIRLEAAAAKDWNTRRCWQMVDETMQVRGGRGYETEHSLLARGEEPVPVERMLRDYRINLIFEGSSEIMRLFMARELVDKHLQVAGGLIDPERGLAARLGVLPQMAAFYGWWYPTRWLGWGRWPRYSEFGRLAGHLRFVERKARKLARASFHGMLVHQGRLQNKQGFLFRLVEVAEELLAMAASVSRAHALRQRPEAREAAELADAFCRGARRQVNKLFSELWRNDDATNYRTGVDVLGGRYQWLEQGTLAVGAQPVSLEGIEVTSPADRREEPVPVG